MLAKIMQHAPAAQTPVNRRAFLIGAIAAAGGLAVGFRAAPALAQAAKGDQAAPNPFAAYVKVKPNNQVRVLSGQFDMGQGSYHGLASLVVEELGASWDQVKVVGVHGDLSAYGNLTAGGQFQFTGGSSSIASSFDRYRLAGATAREMLKAAAAEKLGVPAEQLTVKDGVISGGGKSVSFGEVAAAAAKLPVPQDVALKPRAQWDTIGDPSVRRFDTEPKTRGAFTYTADVQLPGLLTAVMIHPPRFGAKVRSYDASKALAMDGVEHVVQIHRGIAVVGRTMYHAMKGADAVSVDWDESQAETRGTDTLMAEYETAVNGAPAAFATDSGDAAGAIENADQLVEMTYRFPYLAHAALEPLNAVAHMREDGVLDLYGGHQMPDYYQATVSKMTGLPAEKINMIIMPTGGGYGRRGVLDVDVVSEAAMVAKAIDYAAPVKVQWMRENDMRGGRYRPATVHKVRGGLDKDGNLVGWDSHIVSQSIMQGTVFDTGAKVDNTVVEGAANLPYDVANLRIGATMPQVGVPVLWWRAVGSTHTAYVVETFIDELAAKAGRDPVEFRLAMLKEKPRHAGVLKLAAEKAGWGKKLPDGRFHGVAMHESFNTYVAQVAEISMQDGRPKVHKVVCAVDCGTVVNPDTVRAQMEGGIGFGLGAITDEEITMVDGRVEQGNYDSYTPLRLDAMPSVEVHIVDSTESSTGVGEPGVPPIGPAVANAVRAATGQTITNLPLAKGMTV